MPTDIRMQFGNRLRYLREKKNLTQEELARRSKVSYKYIQNLEGKKPQNVGILTLEKLAKGLDVSIAKLLDIR